MRSAGSARGPKEAGFAGVGWGTGRVKDRRAEAHTVDGRGAAATQTTSKSV